MPTPSKITNANILILLDTAKNLKIKTKIISANPIKILFTKDNISHIISQKSMQLNTSSKAKNISKDKSLTLQKLSLSNLPIPRHSTVSSLQNYQNINIPFPQVIKPQTGEKGKHIFLNIKTKSQAEIALKQVLSHYPSAIIETYHKGNDYRFLLLNHQVIGLAQRLPAQITANGKSTIKQLIQAENHRRHQNFLKTGKRMLNRMRNWPRLSHYLHLQGLSLKAIPPQGKIITLYPIPNFSIGGSTKTINPKIIHPDLINLAQSASKTIGLNICGIDIIIKPSSYLLEANTSKPSKTLSDLSGECRIIEVNSDPGLRLHDWPNQGKSQHTAKTILKSIFS